jgi:PAS domain S-box-containing protein
MELMTARTCDNDVFRELVETLPIVTYVVSSGPDGRTLYVSPQIEQLLGYPVQDWFDDPDFFENVVHPDDRPRVLSKTEARSVTKDTSTTFRVVARDGSVITVQSDLVVKRDECGRPAHVFGFWIDISQRVRLSAELRQAQKLEAVGRLASGVAHDFNNVLLAQRGYGELALQHLEREDLAAAQNDVREILGVVGRGANLTGQLLAFSRRQVIDVEVLDLNAVVAELEGLLRGLIGEGVIFAFWLAPAPVLVQAHRGQLEQVVTNLIVNARDAMPTGGELQMTVQTANSGRTAILEIADTGIGMDSATAEHIFEPFFTTKGAGGTGLGLATVHGIVTQSGGAIAVQSAPARGSTFTVSLPTTDQPASPVGRHEPSTSRANGETILVVEDDAAVRAVVAAMLELQGYQVHAAANADGAIEVARSQGREIDLLVTDVMLPGRQGPATVDIVRELRPGLAVLYMSGHPGNVRLPELGPATGSRFIQKPFSAAELAQAVAELLADRGSPSTP